VTIASKFLICFRGKHLFDPTNFGLVLLILLTGKAWLTAGHWGNEVVFAFLLACLGSLVVCRASRFDVTLAFRGFQSVLLIGRQKMNLAPSSLRGEEKEWWQKIWKDSESKGFLLQRKIAVTTSYQEQANEILSLRGAGQNDSEPERPSPRGVPEVGNQSDDEGSCYPP
jgi:hypothetical protein